MVNWSKKKADFFVEICYNDMMRIVISKKIQNTGGNEMTAKDKKGRSVELPVFLTREQDFVIGLGTFYEVIHIKTRVMYVCLNRNESALTHMLNSDGTPLLATYEEVIELLGKRGIYVE